MKSEKLIVYVVVGFIAYVLFTRYQATVAAARVTAAGNSTAGIIGASVGGLGAVISDLSQSSDSDDYY